VKRIRKKPAKTADSDARIDLVRGVFLLALFVQLLGVRWIPPSVNEEVVFQAAGGFLRTGVPALSGTPEAAAMAQEVSKARKTGEACELGFIWQDPEGLSVAVGHTPPGAMLVLLPAHILGRTLDGLFPDLEASYRTGTRGKSSEVWAHILAALLGPLMGAICCAALVSSALSLGASRPTAAMTGVVVGLGTPLASASAWPEPALLAAAFLAYGLATLLHLATAVGARKTVGRLRFWGVGCALALALLMDMRIWPLVLLTLAFGEAGLRRAQQVVFPFGRVGSLFALMGPVLIAIAWSVLGSGPLAEAGRRHWYVHTSAAMGEVGFMEWLGAGGIALAFAPCLAFGLIGAGRMLGGVDRLVGALTWTGIGVSMLFIGDRNAHGPAQLVPLLVFLGPAVGLGLGFVAGLPLGKLLVGGVVIWGLTIQVGSALVDPDLANYLEAELPASDAGELDPLGPQTGVRWRILRRQKAMGDGSFPLGEIFALEEESKTVMVEGLPGRWLGHLALPRLGGGQGPSFIATLAGLLLFFLAGWGGRAVVQGLDPARWP